MPFLAGDEGEGRGGDGRKQEKAKQNKTIQYNKTMKPFKLKPSEEDTEQPMLNVTILTAETARLKLSHGVVLLDLRRERLCISKLLTISKIYAILHQ